MEIDSFSKSFEINGFKNSITKTWKIIACCISAYFIQNSYNKLTKNRIYDFFNNQEKNDSFFPIKNKIKPNDYIMLRNIKNGFNFFVHLIFHIEKEELFVLKISRPNEDSKIIAAREINNFSNIKHAFIPKFIGTTVDNSLVIEFINGHKIKEHDFSNDKEIAYIIIQIMIVIEFLHHNHYIYRNLNSNNILIEDNKNIILINFEYMIKNNAVIESTTVDLSSFVSYDISHLQIYSYESDIETIGKIVKYISDKLTNEMKEINYIKTMILDDICDNCITDDHTLRPSIYGMIRCINEYFHFQNQNEYFWRLLNLNRYLAIQNINDDINNPYKQIILGFIFLEDSYYMNKRGENKNNFEIPKSYFEKAKKHGFKEAEFALKIINDDQKSSSTSLNKSIYRFLTDYKLDEKKEEIKSELENFDISIIIDILAIQDDPFYQYIVGSVYIGIIEFLDISENVFNMFRTTNLFQYQDYINYKDITEYILTEIKKIKPDLEKGINYIKISANKGFIGAKILLGMLHLMNGYNIKIDDINNIEFVTSILNIKNPNIMKVIKTLNKCGNYIKFNKQIGIDYLTEAAMDSDFIKYVLGKIYFD